MNPYANGEWNLIDYVGIVLSEESKQALYQHLETNGIRNELRMNSGNFFIIKEQVVTVAYSYSRIKWNPMYQDLDGELIIPIDRLINVDEGMYRWNIFTDPNSAVQSLVLEFDSDFIRNYHQNFVKKQEADWVFDDYTPQLRIVTGIVPTLDEIASMPLPDFKLIFDRIKYSRFCEQII